MTRWLPNVITVQPNLTPDHRLRAAGLPNGTRNYPDADRRIMRGYQARAHVGRGSLCVVLFTDWGCDGRRVSSLPRIPAQQRPPCLGSLPPGRVSRFQGDYSFIAFLDFSAPKL